MPIPSSPRIQFRAGDLLPYLTVRASAGDDPALAGVADRDLHRYYALLAASMPPLTESEASLIVDALNGTMLDSTTARLLWAEIDDAIRLNDLDRKWSVPDPLEFVARLRALSTAEALSIVDGAERYWCLNNQGLPTSEALRKVGMVAPDTVIIDRNKRRPYRVPLNLPPELSLEDLTGESR